MSLVPPIHDCSTGSRYKCARNGKPAEVSIPRCAHGVSLTTPCQGCRVRGGAFVFADGRKHVGGCRAESHDLPENQITLERPGRKFGDPGIPLPPRCNCSFGRAPIYDKRPYRDIAGVELHPKPAFDLAAHGLSPATYRQRRSMSDPIIQDHFQKRIAALAPKALSQCSAALLPDSGVPDDLHVSTPEEIAHFLDDLARNVGLENSWRETPKIVAKPLPPRELLRPHWVAPTFTLIPRIILDHSQPPVPKTFTNFCPTCFSHGEVTEHSEGGFSSSTKEWITTRVFVRTEKRYGVHVPQKHECGERPAA